VPGVDFFVSTKKLDFAFELVWKQEAPNHMRNRDGVFPRRLDAMVWPVGNRSG
jgi:hypothetical protein